MVLNGLDFMWCMCGDHVRIISTLVLAVAWARSHNVITLVLVWTLVVLMMAIEIVVIMVSKSL